jgi:hypothetical protein
LLCHLKEDRKAVSPAISSVILTAAVIVMILVAIAFASNFLDARIAENDFSAMKQFMQTVALQTDDVAWIPGRTQTVRYASKYGQVKFQSLAFSYSFYYNGSPIANLSYSVGVVLFNMPVKEYSLGNNYFQRIFPSSNRFLQNDTSAPVCRVSVIEKLPMADGDYIRIVAAPLIRQLSSTINNVTYIRLYLPVLKAGPHPQNSLSVTLTGKNVTYDMISNINTVKIELGFPNGNATGLTQDFFRFDTTTETISVTPSSVIEIYTGEVLVSLGLYA